MYNFTLRRKCNFTIIRKNFVTKSISRNKDWYLISLLIQAKLKWLKHLYKKNEEQEEEVKLI